METRKTIETSTSSVWIDDGFIRVVKRPNTNENLQDAKEVVAAIRELTGGTKSPILVDFRNLESQDEEAKKYYAGWFSENKESACALLVGAPGNTKIANQYMGLSMPIIPTRVFKDEKMAIEWLKQYL
ncbi:MAG: hypothetical protein JKY33_04150 [Bacteroidia bacterium]|nr:hypothetical protein [Bacteroidia bacterium]